MFSNSKEQNDAEHKTDEGPKGKIKRLEREILRIEADLKPLIKAYNDGFERCQRDNATKWQYMQLLDVSEKRLATMGEWGWELVSTVTAPTSKFSLSEGQTNIWSVLYIFKRELLLDPPELEDELLRIAEKEAELDRLKQELAQLS